MTELTSGVPRSLKPEDLAAGTVAFASTLFEQFIEEVAVVLLDRLLLTTEFEVRPHSQQLLSQTFAGSVQPVSAFALNLSPYSGYAWLVFDQGLLGAALEIVLGASAEMAGCERKWLTSLEMEVLDDFVDLVAGALRRVWQPYCGSSFERVPNRPWQVAAEDDLPVLSLTSSVNVMGKSGTMRLVLPSGLLRLRSFQAPGTKPEAEAEQAQALAEAIVRIPVRSEALLAGARIQLADLLRLKPGSVLSLPYKQDCPIGLWLNGVEKYSGRLIEGAQGLAFEIHSTAGAGSRTQDETVQPCPAI